MDTMPSFDAAMDAMPLAAILRGVVPEEAAAVKAMRAVLPPATRLLPVGGISVESMAGYWRAGAAGFGIGSALYAPEKPQDSVAADARRFAEAMRGLRGRG